MQSMRRQRWYATQQGPLAKGCTIELSKVGEAPEHMEGNLAARHETWLVCTTPPPVWCLLVVLSLQILRDAFPPGPGTTALPTEANGDMQTGEAGQFRNSEGLTPAQCSEVCSGFVADSRGVVLGAAPVLSNPGGQRPP
jgi:hypothetical protein